MDIRTGKIMTEEEADARIKKNPRLARFLKPMVIPPTPYQMGRSKVGRNDPCPCGSGKKFKRCCWTRRD